MNESSLELSDVKVSIKKTVDEMIKNGTWKFENNVFWQAFPCGVAGYGNDVFYLDSIPNNAKKFIKSKIKFILGLEIDLDDFYSQISDSKFSFLIDEFCGLVPPAAVNPYQALVETIAQQQISFEFAMKTINNLVKICGKKIDNLLCFPEANEILRIGNQIKKAKLGYRADYIISLTKEFLSGKLDFSKVEKMNEKEAIKYLTSFRGIGRWSAELFLTYGFRKNTYPAGDLGIRRGLSRIFGLRLKEIKESDVRELIEPYGKWKSLLAFYITAYDRKLQSERNKNLREVRKYRNKI